jgi:hypothetical protein
MAKSEPTKQASSGGCFSKLLVLILLVAVAGLGAAVFFVVQPQNLTDIGGYGPAFKPVPERDLKEVLKNSIDRGYPIVLSESEINRWLAQNLMMKQGGFLGDQIKLERFWVRLEDGRAELIMERSIMGHSFTTSMYMQIVKQQGARETITNYNPAGGAFIAGYPIPQKGGRLGQLVVPQGFLHLVLPSYEKIANLFAPETELAFKKMQHVKFEKGKLYLDPRETTGPPGPTTTF